MAASAPIPTTSVSFVVVIKVSLENSAIKPNCLLRLAKVLFNSVAVILTSLVAAAALDKFVLNWIASSVERASDFWSSTICLLASKSDLINKPIRNFRPRGSNFLNPAKRGFVISGDIFAAFSMGFIISIAPIFWALAAAAAWDIPLPDLSTNCFSKPNLLITSLVNPFPLFKASSSNSLCFLSFSKFLSICALNFSADSIFNSFCLAASAAASEASAKALVIPLNPGIAFVIASKLPNTRTPVVLLIFSSSSKISWVASRNAVFLSNWSWSSAVSSFDKVLESIDCWSNTKPCLAFVLNKFICFISPLISPFLMSNNFWEIPEILFKEDFAWVRKIFCFCNSFTLCLKDMIR